MNRSRYDQVGFLAHLQTLLTDPEEATQVRFCNGCNRPVIDGDENLHTTGHGTRTGASPSLTMLAHLTH